MKKVLTVIKTFLPYVFIVGALITLCLSGDYFNLLELKDAPRLISGELLAVIITASVTALLLNSQTQQQAKLLEAKSERELKKERFAVIFQKKAKTYDEYVKTLILIAKDRKISEEEADELTDDLSFKLGMYLEKEESGKKIYEAIQKMRKAPGNPEVIRDSTGEILKVLRDDLKEGD